jgi:hypothetical protein
MPESRMPQSSRIPIQRGAGPAEPAGEETHLYATARHRVSPERKPGTLSAKPAERSRADGSRSDSLTPFRSAREDHVEVKIGVQFAPRELVLESNQTPAEVEATVSDVIERGTGTLSLMDDRCRRVIVPVDKIAYVEIAESSPRPVGFTAS